MTKWVYLFTEGNADMRNLLGGKGANLAEMTNIGLPVPQGFTITTEACTKYYEDGSIGKIDGLKHKMLGLNKEKYDVFFIPYDNLEEANEINEKYKLNMKFVPVKTFDEAIDYLNSVNN